MARMGENPWGYRDGGGVDGQDHLPDQIQELFRRFPELNAQSRPLSRCVECNSLLVPVAKENVRGKVWPYVYQSQQRFTTCPDCHRIYWEATHVAKIRQILGHLGLHL